MQDIYSRRFSYYLGLMPKSKSKRTTKQPPPKPGKPKRSAPWVGALMFTFMAAGMIIIICNYLGLFPDGTTNFRLWLGLGCIAGSFVVATQWH